MVNEILVSLGDGGLKDIAEVLASKSCVAILNLLALSPIRDDPAGPNDLAVSDIARELGMKLNTVDYNVKKLVKAGLIEKSGHWWSVKGKKMPVYQVVDRRIVISPRRRIAAKFLWVLGLTGVVGIWLRQWAMGNGQWDVVRSVSDEAVFGVAPKAAVFASDVGASETIAREVSSISFWGGLASWEWFLIGAWTSIVLFFIFSLVSERRDR